MKVTSPDFEPGGRLDDRHSFGSENVAPRIVVSDVPEGTRELALILHDPDAPLPHGFTHWLRYGLPAHAGEISSDAVAHRDGVNEFGKRGYGGPMPPVGHGPHHYFFWVYALSEPVAGEPGRLQFLDEYADRIVAQARVVGVYSR
jgi:Raf kinase inhibitor-like YbhB/YbcL family protein